jgi:hypothetical protein
MIQFQALISHLEILQMESLPQVVTMYSNQFHILLHLLLKILFHQVQ